MYDTDRGYYLRDIYISEILTTYLKRTYNRFKKCENKQVIELNNFQGIKKNPMKFPVEYYNLQMLL